MVLWVAHRFVVNFGCETQTMAMSSLPAADVEVVYMNCDTLAKTESIDVYLMRPGGNRWPAMLRWIYGRTLVFRYDPAGINGPDGPKPEVTEESAGIHVTIPHVSSVQVEKDGWENKSIGYRIGKIDYP